MTEKHTLKNIFYFLTFIIMLLSIFAIFWYAPVEKTMGIVQKIFYIHVPSAFLAFFAFFVTFVSSIAYLIKKSAKWDALALSSAEIGIIFCTIVLVTGPIWARPIWNVWWTWDPRLVTTLILWFVYVAYLMLRGATGEHRRSNFAAVFGILGFVNVPITFISIRLWRTIHPVVITAKGINISAPMLNTLLLSLLAFTLFYFYLLSIRFKLETLRLRVEQVNAYADQGE